MSEINDEHSLNENGYNFIIEEFCKYRKQLSEKIKSPEIVFSKEECYLIEKSYIDKLKEGYKKYKTFKNKQKVDNYNYFKLMPDYTTFINSFVSIVNNLKEDKNFFLVNRKLLENIYTEDVLKAQKYVEYFSGNNTLLIKFQNEYESIFLIDPLNENEIQNRIFIILMKDKENNNELQKLINEKKQFNVKSEEKYNDITIIPYKIYINIIKLFVHLFYYQKDLLNNPEEIFKENEDYYLISNEWLDNFKKYYKTLNIEISKDNNIKYNDVENKLKENIYLIKNYKYKKELFNKTLNIYGIMPNKYYSNCYIITSQMMNIIKSIFNINEIDFPKRKIIIMNDYIYLILSSKLLSVGNLNQNFIFELKYLISYSSVEIFESEKEHIFKNSIEDYIKSNNCDLNNSELQHILRNNIIIAKLVIKRSKSIGNQLESINEKKTLYNKNVKLETIKSENDKINIPLNKINDIKNEKNDMLKDKNEKAKKKEEKIKNKIKKENTNEKITPFPIENKNKEYDELKKSNYDLINQKNEEKKIDLNDNNININKFSEEKETKLNKELELKKDLNKKNEKLINDKGNMEEKPKEFGKLKENNKINEYKIKNNEKTIKGNDKIKEENIKKIEKLEKNTNVGKEIEEKNKNKEQLKNEYNNNLNEYKNILEQKDKTIQELRKIIAETNNQTEKLISSILDNNNKESEELKQKYDKILNNKNKEIEELKAKYKEYESIIENKNKEYEELLKTNNDLLNKKEEEYIKLNNDYINIKKLLQKKEEKLNKLKDCKIFENNIKEENDDSKLKMNKEINNLKEKINNLKKELQEEKNKNKISEQNISTLKDKFDEELRKSQFFSNNRGTILNTSLNDDAFNIILEKEKEIKILKEKLSRFPFELNEGEKLMSVIFTSSEQSFYQSIICKNTEKLNNIENRLYDIDRYKNYAETENYFMAKGNKLNKSKTLEQNRINESDIIVLNVISPE